MFIYRIIAVLAAIAEISTSIVNIINRTDLLPPSLFNVLVQCNASGLHLDKAIPIKQQRTFKTGSRNKGKYVKRRKVQRITINSRLFENNVKQR